MPHRAPRYFEPPTYLRELGAAPSLTVLSPSLTVLSPSRCSEEVERQQRARMCAQAAAMLSTSAARASVQKQTEAEARERGASSLTAQGFPGESSGEHLR